MIIILGYELTYLELFGSIFSFIAVILASMSNIWNWPLSIVGQVLFFFLFMNNHLYGNMILQVFFTAVCIYGWYYWKIDDGEKIKLKLKHTTIISIASCLIGSYILSRFQTENVFLDASTTALSVIAVFLLSQKYLSSWVLWIIVDVLSAILFANKGMNLISIEYILMTVIATYGLINWIKLYKKQKLCQN